MKKAQDQDTVQLILEPIPKRWRQDRLCNVAELRTSNVNKKSEDGEQLVQLCNYVDVYYNNKITNKIDFMQATANENEIKRFSLKIDDVVITKDSESPDDIGIPALIAGNVEDLVCGYHLTILRPIEDVICGRYLYYAMASQFSAYQFYLAANGVTRFGLTYQGTKNLKIAFPERAEQQKIADFLDWKTGQIDGLISKKKQLIENLKEKRIALITQAVTKGLNPDAPMRDSGIPWLGEVPKHWMVMKLHHIVRMKSGSNIISTDIEAAGDFPVYGGNGVRGYFEKYTHKGSFVLVGRQGALCGNINYAHGKFWASEHAVVAAPDRELDVVWLGETLRAMNLNQYSESAAQPGLSVEAIGRLEMPFPPLDEQGEIANIIRIKTAKIDKLMNVTIQTIFRLNEYRTALITASTTGKIDLRNVKIGGTA